MPKLNIYLLASLACFFTTMASAYTSADNSEAQRVITYTKDGRLYKYEVYLGNSKVPIVVNQTSSEGVPAGAIKHTYPSLEAFTLNNTVAPKVQALGDADAKVAIGLIPSVQSAIIGMGPKACYKSDPSVDRGTNISMQSKLIATSSDAADSSLMSNDTSVKAGFDGFHSKVDNTYSKSYAGEIATGEYNLAAAVTTVINTNIKTKDNLTTNGIDLFKNKAAFMERCGTAGVAAFIGGILTTVNIKTIAINHSAATNFSNSVSAGWGPDDVSNAFKSAKSNNEKFNKVTFTFTTYGNIKFNQPLNGANDYDNYIAKSVEANAKYQALCEAESKPDLTACATFMSNMSNAVTAGMEAAKAAISNKDNGPSFGADTLYFFPDGLNFAHNSGKTKPTYRNPQISAKVGATVTYAAANNDGETMADPFLPSSANNENMVMHLKNAVRVIYQLNALAARAKLLGSLAGHTTAEENKFFDQLAQLYTKDANEIGRVSYNCYNAIIEKASSAIPECNSKITIARDAEEFTLHDLPNNVYQLYNKNPQSFPETGSIQELLFENTLALQYNVDYIEVGTSASSNEGKCSKSCDMVRASNQIGFGVAYYNRSLYSPEFFGGSSKVPMQVAGYIFPNTITPQLGLEDNNFKYKNSSYGENDAGRSGVYWWQQHKDEKVIFQTRIYQDSPLYAVYNWPNLFQLDKDSRPITPSFVEANGVRPSARARFNKIIGSNTTTGDSSATQDNRTLDWYREDGYIPLTIDELLKGEKLRPLLYSFFGNVTTEARSEDKKKSADQCFAGLYVPQLNYPGKNRTAQLPSNATYGSTNAEHYLCNKNPDSKYPWTNFRLLPGHDPVPLKDMEVKSTLAFIPVDNFFGLSN